MVQFRTGIENLRLIFQLMYPIKRLGLVSTSKVTAGVDYGLGTPRGMPDIVTPNPKQFPEILGGSAPCQ